MGECNDVLNSERVTLTVGVMNNCEGLVISNNV